MNDERLSELFINEISLLQGSNRISKINKGYSYDQKFIVEKDNQTYLLRSFALNELSAKQAEFAAIRQMQNYDVLCSKPIEMGSLPNSNIGYMLLTYIDGDEATDILPAYSPSIQQAIGLEAGRELAKMHKLLAPAAIAPWHERKLAKHKRYIEQYLNGDARLKGDTAFLAFIDRHLHLMEGRPNVFQHDDFHVGNLIVKNGKLAGVIDFNRLDWGDPVHEFLKAGMFSSEVSIPFTIGQIKGYHVGQEPDEQFWTLYSLYLAMTIVSSIVWILQVRPSELGIMTQKLERVLEDHDHFNNIIPRWYLEERSYETGSL
ncbi:aminoglycoside phosphotransferase family protein [Paenibacillus sp. FJAT-27812]|uniref:aminoglycoside phosphotransferase family protein n=1 Tax=Paenibacillus sp. FJAT-27812 TaxID=1684143 RepID=UPI0009EC3DCA|nr:aminoglycoside phosphotransferase family protein [Paenibacillus sp. FJAT-27812]